MDKCHCNNYKEISWNQEGIPSYYCDNCQSKHNLCGVRYRNYFCGELEDHLNEHWNIQNTFSWENKPEIENKTSKLFERDFQFYLSCIEKKLFDFCGEAVTWPLSKSGLAAKEAFYIINSVGGNPECSEPELLCKLITIKKGINLQIKQWAEGIAEGTLYLFELVEYLNEIEALPWIILAVKNQAKKLIATGQIFPIIDIYKL